MKFIGYIEEGDIEVSLEELKIGHIFYHNYSIYVKIKNLPNHRVDIVNLENGMNTIMDDDIMVKDSRGIFSSVSEEDATMKKVMYGETQEIMEILEELISYAKELHVFDGLLTLSYERLTNLYSNTYPFDSMDRIHGMFSLAYDLKEKLETAIDKAEDERGFEYEKRK